MFTLFVNVTGVLPKPSTIRTVWRGAAQVEAGAEDPGALTQLAFDEVLARLAADGDLLADLLPEPPG